MKELSLEDYSKLVEGSICQLCRKKLAVPALIEHYPHSDGWKVKGFKERQWLSVRCPEPCDYGNSLWKLGVPGCLNEVQNAIAIEDRMDFEPWHFL